MNQREHLRDETCASEEEPREQADESVGKDAAPGPFTRFMQEWEPGREPEPTLAAAMWSAFGRLVHQELRRRLLTQTSPHWLGIYGFRGWWEAAGRGGPFEDLLAEAYRYIFVKRFAALKEQALAKANIEGVVVASVRNFLHDRQRLHDRLGARLFEVLSAAARFAVARGDLEVVAGSAKIGSSTVLAVGERSGSADLARPEMLAAIVRRWNDELLPDLVTASRADKRRLIEELASRLASLDLAGVQAFRFGDLIAPLKTDVRQRWAALLAPAEEEEPADDEDTRGFRRLRRSFEPTAETQVIAADRLTKLIDCVQCAIQASPTSERTRDYLRRILLFIRAWATEEGAAPVAEGGGDADRLPSFRRLAEHLEIPRERFKELMKTLKTFLKRCREKLDSELVRLRAGSRGSEEVQP